MSPTSILRHCSRGAVTLDDSCKAVTWNWCFISCEHLSSIFMCVGWNDYIVRPAFNAASIFHRTQECGGGGCSSEMKPSKDESEAFCKPSRHFQIMQNPALRFLSYKNQESLGQCLPSYTQRLKSKTLWVKGEPHLWSFHHVLRCQRLKTQTVQQWVRRITITATTITTGIMKTAITMT